MGRRITGKYRTAGPEARPFFHLHLPATPVRKASSAGADVRKTAASRKMAFLLGLFSGRINTLRSLQPPLPGLNFSVKS